MRFALFKIPRFSIQPDAIQVVIGFATISLGFSLFYPG